MRKSLRRQVTASPCRTARQPARRRSLRPGRARITTCSGWRASIVGRTRCGSLDPSARPPAARPRGACRRACGREDVAARPSSSIAPIYYNGGIEHATRFLLTDGQTRITHHRITPDTSAPSIPATLIGLHASASAGGRPATTRSRMPSGASTSGAGSARPTGLAATRRRSSTRTRASSCARKGRQTHRHRSAARPRVGLHSVALARRHPRRPWSAVRVGRRGCPHALRRLAGQPRRPPRAWSPRRSVTWSASIAR